MALILDKEFYTNRNVLEVSSQLLGKKLCTIRNGKLTSGLIVELEAYKAPEDKASHAYKNKLTNRTSVMFGEGGLAYVYLCYGIHRMFNVVSSIENEAHAILIRAIQPIDGQNIMSKRRGEHLAVAEWCSGPGKLCKALDIRLDQTGNSLVKSNNGFWIEDIGEEIDSENIIKSPRVGIKYAEEYAHLPWRYRIKDNKFTSKPYKVIYPQ